LRAAPNEEEEEEEEEEEREKEEGRKEEAKRESTSTCRAMLAEGLTGMGESRPSTTDLKRKGSVVVVVVVSS
jgi:hypothetical protein